jgi:hypothetical protein
MGRNMLDAPSGNGRLAESMVRQARCRLVCGSMVDAAHDGATGQKNRDPAMYIVHR